MKNPLSRRGFIRTAAAGSAALTWLNARRGPNVFAAEADKPALLGGTPVHKGGWLAWPQWRQEWEPKLCEVYRSRKWFRRSDTHVADFEKAYAELLGARKCLATASGTTALIVSLHVMDVDAGDEVI
ncbi:MAG: DegT/DnrJ/EryC1/StrS family aminotransferase, partial [Verrucomicrobia bacterium]|nr:DegT/DnrJ/EryC1/StrS family aminotransferase [Verrucomicrobiota bacterium]